MSSPVLLRTLRLFSDDLQVLRDEIYEINTEFSERLNRSQEKVDSLCQRVYFAMAMASGDNSQQALDIHALENLKLGGGVDEKPVQTEDTISQLDIKEESQSGSSYQGQESNSGDENKGVSEKSFPVPVVFPTFQPTVLKTSSEHDVLKCEDGSLMTFVKRHKMTGIVAQDEKIPKTPDFEHANVFHGIEIKTIQTGRQGRDRIFTCYCGQLIEYSYRKMIQHFMQRTVKDFKEKFRCRLCGFKCLSSFNLQVHSKRTHQHKVYTCGICFQELDSEVSHYVHLYTDQTECGKFVAQKKANGEPWMLYLLI